MQGRKNDNRGEKNSHQRRHTARKTHLKDFQQGIDARKKVNNGKSRTRANKTRI